MGTKLKLTAIDYGNGVTSANQPVKGMFFFSGTGPAGAVCGHCGHKTPSMIKAGRDEKGKMKEVESHSYMFCGKALNYFKGNARKATEIHVATPACKYFINTKET